MPCNAMPCYTMPCHAMPCHTSCRMAAADQAHRRANRVVHAAVDVSSQDTEAIHALLRRWHRRDGSSHPWMQRNRHSDNQPLSQPAYDLYNLLHFAKPISLLRHLIALIAPQAPSCRASRHATWKSIVARLARCFRSRVYTHIYITLLVNIYMI